MRVAPSIVGRAPDLTQHATRKTPAQCRCGPPRPQPQPAGFAMQVGAAGLAPPAVAEANTENFFVSFVEPQFGHGVPCQSLERMRISLSVAHCSQ